MAENNYQPAQVPVTNPDQAVGSTASGTSKLGTAVTNVNIADQQASAGATLRDIFMYDGAGILDSTLESSRAAAFKGFQKAIAPSQKTVANLGPQITNAKSNIASLQAELADPATSEKRKAQITNKLLPKATNSLAKMEKSYEAANTKIADQRESYTTSVERLMADAPKMTDLLAEKTPEAAKLAADSKQYLAKMGQLGPAGESLDAALSKGYTAGDISYNPAAAAQMGAGQRIGQMNAARVADINAVLAARVADVRAQQVGAGQLGSSLMGRAQTMANSTGQLNEQATRDAVQAARQGFAARGMATGNAALGAELLNRDRYARSRMFEDLGFARNIQIDDVDRQMRNAQNTLTGDIANQSTATNLSISDQQAAMDALKSNQGTATTLSVADLNAAMEGAKANQTDATNRDSAQLTADNYISVNNASQDLVGQGMQQENLRLENTANIGMLGDRYNLQTGVNNEALRGLALGSSLDSAANKYNMALGLYQGSGTNPGAAALAGATSVVNTANTLASGENQYNAGATDFGHYAPMAFGSYGNQQSGGGWSGAATGAASGAIAGSALGPYGAAGGAVIGGAAGYFSDKRLKKNIKENKYGLEDIAKLKTYQYDYKDGADNEAGVMAQELRRVMPEAVEEVEMMDGKKKVKRLMIKPMFLTAALVNSVKELNGKVAALGSSFTSTKQKPKPMALGDALMALV